MVGSGDDGDDNDVDPDSKPDRFEPVADELNNL